MTLGPEQHDLSMAIAPLVIPAITGLVSLFSGLFGGHKQKQAASQASHGARLQDLLPLIMPMIQQQQQHSAQNYQQQQDRYAQVQPLQDAIARMSMQLMPRTAQKQPPKMPGL